MVRAEMMFVGRMVFAVVVCVGMLVRISSAQTPPSPPFNTVGIAGNSPSFVEWANSATVIPGPQNIADPASLPASNGTPSNAMGPADAVTVSLGDGGQATLQFAQPIFNGPGADFAVFENGFSTGTNSAFLELGFVDVSSDGVNYVRFPSISDTSTTTQVGTFGSLNPTLLYDFAGETLANFGTPFDLSELAGKPNLDINDIKYVRITDVIGNINESLGAGTYSLDSLLNVVNDPFPDATNSTTGGFDLDAVGVLNAVPEPAAGVLMLWALAGWAICAKRSAGLGGASSSTRPTGKRQL